MGKRQIAMEVRGSKDEIPSKLHSVLKESGYRVKIKPNGQMTFSGGSIAGSGALEKSHKLHVTLRPSEFGMSLTILIETGIGEPGLDLDIIENHVRSQLAASFEVGNPLFKGKVSDDGTEVHLMDPNSDISIGPFKNNFAEHGKALLAFGIFTTVFFGIILIAFIYDMIFDVTGTATIGLAPYFIGFMLFLILLGPALLFYGRRTKRFPTRILPTFEGVYLYYLKAPTIFVPWDRVTKIEFPKGFNVLALFWRTDEGKEVFAGMKDPAVGFVSDMHQSMLKGFDKVYAQPAFRAFYLVPPKTEVYATRKPLSEEEIVYGKLGRRFLSKGPLIPIYVKHEDHIQIARDYLSRRDLNKEELAEAAKEASSNLLWDLGADLLERIVKGHPDDEEFNHNLAGCYLEADRVDEGLEVVNNYLDKHPDSSRCNFMKALLTMKIHRVDEALYHVGRAVELDRNNVPALSLWFEIVENESGTSQAISELDYLSSRYADAWGPHLVLGYKVFGSGNIEESLKRMKKAYETEVNLETVHGIGNVLFQMQDIDGMIEVLEKYKEKNPLPPELIINLAGGYSKRGEKVKAYELLDTIDYSMGIDWVGAADDLRMQIRHSM